MSVRLTSLRAATLIKAALLAPVLAVSAAPALAQTWTVTSLDTIGCNASGTRFTVNFSGTSSGSWFYDTTVDVAGSRYMDERVASALDGNFSWHLYDANDLGQQTATFPMPAATPITVTMTLRDSTLAARYRTVVTLSRCDGGTMLSNVGSVVAVAPPAAVPTLSEWALLALGLAAAGIGARRLRRSA